MYNQIPGYSISKWKHGVRAMVKWVKQKLEKEKA
jgi:hypothetical protein